MTPKRSFNSLSLFLWTITFVLFTFTFIWDKLYLFERDHLLSSITFSIVIVCSLVVIIMTLMARKTRES